MKLSSARSTGNIILRMRSFWQRARRINMLKLAVFCANPRGLTLWRREEIFSPDSDGHHWVVLKGEL